MRPTTLLLVLCLTPVFQKQLPASDWKPFSPAEGHFSVLLPGTPTQLKRSMKNPQGSTEVLLFEVALPAREDKYLVACSEFPPNSIKPGTEDKRLDSARDRAVASAKGKLKRERPIMLDKYPGRELNIEVEGKATVLMRMYAVKNRLYEVVVAGSSEFVTSKDTAKFFESFKFEEK